MYLLTFIVIAVVVLSVVAALGTLVGLMLAEQA